VHQLILILFLAKHPFPLPRKRFTINRNKGA